MPAVWMLHLFVKKVNLEIILLQAQREAEKGKQAAGFGSEQVLKKSQNVFKVKALLSWKCCRSL